MNYFGYLRKIQPHHFFLATGMVLGLLYFMLVPPLQSPDEFNHFYRAWQISDGKMLPQKSGNRLGGKLCNSVDEFYAPFRFKASVPEYRFSLHQLTETFKADSKNKENTFEDFANTSNYSPLCYLPQALVIYTLRGFNASMGWIYYGGRLITFLIWLFIMYHCVKKIPVFKWIVASLALLPTNLYIANTYSADNATNIIVFLWITQVFSHAFGNKEMSLKNKAVLIVLAALLPLVKLVYSPLLLLVFLIPKSIIVKPGKQWLFYFLLFVPPLCIAAWWTSLVSANYISYEDYDSRHAIAATLAPGSDYHRQMDQILSSFTYFPKVILKSIFNPNQLYLETYVGGFGVTLSNRLPAWLWGLFYLIMLIVSGASEQKSVFNLRQTLLVFFSIALSFVFLLLTLHVYWDPVGSGYVWLIQGRYLIPLFPLFFMLYGNMFKFKWKPFVALPIYILAVNTFSFVEIYKEYFKELHAEVYVVKSDFETTVKPGFFNTNNNTLYLANTNNQSRRVKRNGNHSAMVGPASPFGLRFDLKNLLPGDVIEYEIWKKGGSASVVLSGGGKNCKPFYSSLNSGSITDGEGWQKINFWLPVTTACDSSFATFLVYNPNSDTSYFDDVIITHRHKRIPE